MNKKYVGLALTVVVVGGYIYYKFNKAELDQKVQAVEDKALGLLLNMQDRHFNKPFESEAYPETKEDTVHG